MKQALWLCLVISCFQLNAQSAKVKGRLLADGVPLKFTTLSFGELGTVLTDHGGYFERSFGKDVEKVKIHPVDGYRLQYPPDGDLPIPKTDNYTFTVMMTRSEGKEEASERMIAELRTILHQQFLISTDSIEMTIEKQYNGFLENMKNIYQEQFKVLELETMLTQEKQRLLVDQAKLKYLPLITGAFDTYISRTRDLRDELVRRGNDLFHDTGSNIIEVNKRTKAYSEAYEQLNSSRQHFQMVIDYCWKDPYLKKEINDLFRRTIDDFHNEKVLIYSLVLDDIENYNENRRAHRRKNDIKRDIQQYVSLLTNGINNIENEKISLIQQLRDY